MTTTATRFGLLGLALVCGLVLSSSAFAQTSGDQDKPPREQMKEKMHELRGEFKQNKMDIRERREEIKGLWGEFKGENSLKSFL